MSKALCYGIACLDIIVPDIEPEDFHRENVTVEKFSYSTGGDALNQAVTLRKLGHEPVLLTMLGKDIMGEVVVSLANRAGLNTDYITYHDSLPTAVTVVCVHRDGNRNFILNKGSDNAINGQCLPDEILCEGDVLGVGSAYGDVLLTETLKDVLVRAKARGLTTCVDIMQGSFYDDAPGAEDFLPYCDYVFPNEDEGCFLTGEREPDRIAEKLLGWGVGCVVLKLGAEGCRLYRSGRDPISVPGYPVEMVDTTGAGDNFLAGFMAGLLEGKDEVEAARLANACGAVAVKYVGAAGMTGRAEVEALMG